MKILSLRLANLASLPGPLELDFTESPLREAGLFAITGPTGAGKSTLLDALCLALYGNTPRLRQAPGRDAPLPDVEGETLSTADPRTLLRRGTASGHAEVDFLGRDGRRYCARWAVRRAREKAQGRLQAVEQSLRDLDADRLLTTQKREFDRLLPDVLGLNFDQFTRAVLLAQSEFAAFLKADDNERSDLLERLTGTAEYSEISIAAYRRASEAKKAVDALEAKLADDLPAESETRRELERQAESARQALTDLQQQQARLEARQRWHDTDARLRHALDEGRHQQRQADMDWQAMEQARADREWRRVILPQRHRLTRQASLPDDIARQQDKQTRTLDALKQAEATQAQHRQAHEAAEQAMEAARQARQHAEPALREARQQAADLAHLEHQVAQQERTQADLKKQRGELDAEHQQARAEHQRRRQQHDDWQATLAQLMGDHSQLEEARQASQRAFDQAAQRQLALDELSSRWQQYRRAVDHHRRLVDRIQQDEPRLATLLKQGQQARSQLEKARGHHQTVNTVIERGRAVRSESVAALRDGLADGEPCPVCGSLDHPWRHRPPATPEAHQLAAQQQEEERQLKEARDALDSAQQQRDRLFSEYSALEAALKQARQEAQSAEQQSQDARLALENHPLHGELTDIDGAERDTWLADQAEQSKASRSHHQKRLSELSQAEQQIEPLKRALQEDATRLARYETRREGVDKALGELAEQLPPLKAQRDALGSRLKAQLGQHASPDAWQQHLDETQTTAYQARDNALAKYNAACQELQRLTQQRDHQRQRLSELQREYETLSQTLSEWRQANPKLSDATLERLLEQPDEDAKRQEQQLNAAEQARQQAEATLAERRQALLAHRREMTPVDGHADARSEQALLGDRADQAIREGREALASERNALEPTLEEAQRARDDTAFALSDDERKRARRREGQAELDTARADYRRWGQISELIGSADGKLFRRIAQAYNLEQLLEHANVHLSGLSRRYRLRRGGSPLGLLVVDTDMADEQRSVHSLSGGETFLVSLALALGLASMASGELVIESLFIDEGFGSLDPESLALAMDALDGLQALGRRVGVISHVQEMHERIPVQIQVEPLGNGTSHTRIVCP
ncbi:AAA family ATPase [Halomonas urumqiensis]|uniref:Nuclease SbcCD subunit C n=1 Tax=Halomonas urumqiensis TaxID=1684789 RepID=A0A2N7UDC8_9GAMM|nr:AAA family ATPase [Halomonas urumqiensis]PMR78391.1 chromosome segregation protein SMC [Halomonas urumqiensis]PTB03537.1 chromosome segregation protein SMC [Halomonas urumqiensis]GHE20265.1 nuclease SbcCD subunit C [Halomonas urumqiensis]